MRGCLNWFGVALAVLGLGSAGQARDYELTSYTVDCGGVTIASGGDYEAGVTAGQPEVGVQAGGQYTLESGFWFAACDEDVDCNDHDACTVDTCNAFQQCVYTAVNCDDDNICTIDGCDTETGCLHDPVDCSDDDLCTDDYCDPAAGCLHDPVICDDGDRWTRDRCDPAVGCVYLPRGLRAPPPPLWKVDEGR